MGRRVNLAALASEKVLDAPVPRLAATGPPSAVPLSQVAPNPINPREDLGDLGDLESLQSVGQLQPCVVVTRAAFLAVYPEYREAVGQAAYVVVAGSRRRAAAEKFGLPTLDVVVRDQLASSRAQFYAAAVAENIDRRSLDVLEEARAVQRLAEECGSGTQAGAILGKTKGWVSQRLALLKLSVDMQRLLRAGDLPVRDARRLAALPAEDQLPTWSQEREQAIRDRFTAVNHAAGAARDRGHEAAPGASAESIDLRGIEETSGAEKDHGRVPGAARSPRTRNLVIPLGSPVEEIAYLLGNHLRPEDLRALVEALLAEIE